MSLSGSSNEVHRAVVDDSLNIGGLTEDQRQLQATEDRELVGITLGKNSTDGFLEVSFSSSANAGANDNQVNTRAGTLAIMGGSSTEIDLFEGVRWNEGEELHIHEVNNTGAGIEYNMVLYYREV